MINKLEINLLCNISHLLPDAIYIVWSALCLNMIYELPEKVVFKLYNLKRTSNWKDKTAEVGIIFVLRSKNAFMFSLIFQNMAFYMELWGKIGI